MQFRDWSTLLEQEHQPVQISRGQRKYALVCTVNGNIYHRVLINITQRKACFNDEFLGLKACDRVADEL